MSKKRFVSVEGIVERFLWGVVPREVGFLLVQGASRVPARQDGSRVSALRKALNLAINREAIRSKIMYGAAEPMSTYLWPPSIAGYQSTWSDIPYDPALLC